MEIHISDHLLNGKPMCAYLRERDLLLLKRILYEVEFTNGEPEIYSISNEELFDFYNGYCMTNEIKEELSTNLISTTIGIKNDKAEAFMMLKVFCWVKYDADHFDVLINSSIIPYILGIRMGAEMFQGIR